MPFMNTPREYLDNFVVPNFKEFETWPGDARRGLNSTISCHHLTDWVRVALGKTKMSNEAFNAEMDQLHPDMRLLRALTNGTKHFSKRPNDPIADAIPAALHHGPVEEAIKHGWMPGGSMGPLKPYVVPAHIRVTMDDGRQVELRPMLQSVVNWWPGYLESVGL